MGNRRAEALAMFIEVSRTYPASGIAQSAAIAKRIKHDRNLLDSFQALSSDYRAWQSIINAASVHHKTARKENEESRAPLVVKEERVTKIILGETTFALVLCELPVDELDEILALYPSGAENEKNYLKQVESQFLRPAGLKVPPIFS